MIKKSCETVQIIDATAECPSTNFVFDNSKCVKQEYTPITKSCPKGFTSTPSGCIKKTICNAKDVNCPNNSILSGKFCLLEEHSEPIINCLPGYTYTNRECVRREKVPPKLYCGRDYKLQGNECVTSSRVSGELFCESGTLQNKMCSVVTEVDAIINCPKNSFLNGTVCTTIHNVDPVIECPPNFMLKNGECVQKRQEQPKLQCSNGIITQNGQCISTTEILPNVSCEEGYTLNDNVCIKHIEREVQRHCPKNHHYDNDSDLCVSNSKVAKQVPKCTDEIEMIDPDFKCPKDYKTHILAIAFLETFKDT
uniref:Uncharacterized protein LOC113788348 n=1 Tax=Dermatophagoides pteronyssinus TaxID=6956 RepID=A0A6P6XJ96_DERPT|nr:uncharacterized protein LOC113788348 [Dermatophagoides pteronyssinus]